MQPRAAPPRKVPIAMKSKLKNELERLENLGVIAAVDKPTEWVSNLVLATKKSGELRVYRPKISEPGIKMRKISSSSD